MVGTSGPGGSELERGTTKNNPKYNNSNVNLTEVPAVFVFVYSTPVCNVSFHYQCCQCLGRASHVLIISKCVLSW